MKRFKILTVITAVIILSSIAFFCIKNISKPSKGVDKTVISENEKIATTPEKEEVKPTATTENPIPKEEPATTPVATPDNSNKVTTPDDSSKTSTDNKNTTSNTGGNTNTGTKSGNTSGSGSTGSNKGGTSSGSTSGGTTTTPTNPPPAPTPTPPTAPTPTPQPPKYTPSYTLREDLANEIFNAVSKYRQDNGLGALTIVNTYNTTAQNYLSYRIDGQAKPDITNIYAHYTTQEGGWNANALAGVIGRADRWQGGNAVSVKVAQKGEDFYICFVGK